MSKKLVAGPRVHLRPVTLDDAEEFVAASVASRDLHHPWLAASQDTRAFAEYVGRIEADPAKLGFLVCENAGDRIAGFVNLSNIVRGLFQCGALGYAAFAHAAGRGLMSEGLDLMMLHAFGVLGLHRLEANIQPGNAPSIALVRRCGFRLEGLSPDFLFIDGAWRDHERWAITAEMLRA
jgi:[ribosomal protein S5]-alanine N-acetyltransferase